MKRSQVAPFFLAIALVAAFTFAAYGIAGIRVVKELSLSPMVIGIVLGMLFGNTLLPYVLGSWELKGGFKFCSKTLLRTAIVFYGFRLTVGNVMEIGVPGIVIDIIVVTTVLLLGTWLGRRLGLDSDLAILTSSGSAICGAAAVLGTEPVVRAKPYQTAIAVTTVVLFGTIAMFLYPALYRVGVFDLNPTQMALYTGSTLHEVAHVVGAGNAMNDVVIANNAVITKMIRVILLAPFLIILGLILQRTRRGKPEFEGNGGGAWWRRFPWFAIGFLLVICFNSFDLLPHSAVGMINKLDNFALAMAMTALGIDADFRKFKEAGFRPFLLALILFGWLIGVGYLLAKYLAPALA